MMTLEDIKNDKLLLNEIDWDMTPEESVTLYLEWGNNWSHGRMVRSKNDVSYYFVLNTWGDRPKIYLIKRNSEEAVELACLDLPEGLKDVFAKSGNYKKGVYGLNREMREWLQRELE